MEKWNNMFGKLKDKLKSALSIFSKKAEEEADVEEVEVEKEVPVVENVVVKKVEPVKEKIVVERKDEKNTVEKKEEKKVGVSKQEQKNELKQSHSRFEQKVHVEDKKPVSPVSAVPVKKNLLAQQMEHFAKLKEAEKDKQKLEGGKNVVEEKNFTSKIDEDEPEEADEEMEEFDVPSPKSTKEEKIILPIEKEFIEERDENEEKEELKENKQEESTGFFGKLKKTFSFKKEEPVVEEDFADVDLVSTEKVEPKKVVLKPIIIKKKVVVEEELDDEVKPEKKSIFGRIKETITSRTISEEKFEDLFWELELALLENNVSVEVIEKIKVDLKRELVNKPLPWDVSEKIHKTLTKTLHDILAFESEDIFSRISAKKKGPYVIAFFGINGAGKTTSIAKLTYYLQQQGLSVVLAACDTFRAAAIQQLGEHAQKLNVKMIQHNYGSDAAAVAFDAVQYAEKNKVNVVLIDTAGRLHSNTNLMAELQKIIRVVKPDLKIFVGESITGNDCIEQARQFNALVEMDGAILTKVDVDEKGGAPLSIAYTIKKPILFLGVGQEYKDFEKFDAEVILGRLGL